MRPTSTSGQEGVADRRSAAALEPKLWIAGGLRAAASDDCRQRHGRALVGDSHHHAVRGRRASAAGSCVKIEPWPGFEGRLMRRECWMGALDDIPCRHRAGKCREIYVGPWRNPREDQVVDLLAERFASAAMNRCRSPSGALLAIDAGRPLVCKLDDDAAERAWPEPHRSFRVLARGNPFFRRLETVIDRVAVMCVTARRAVDDRLVDFRISPSVMRRRLAGHVGDFCEHAGHGWKTADRLRADRHDAVLDFARKCCSCLQPILIDDVPWWSFRSRSATASPG